TRRSSDLLLQAQSEDVVEVHAKRERLATGYGNSIESSLFGETQTHGCTPARTDLEPVLRSRLGAATIRVYGVKTAMNNEVVDAVLHETAGIRILRKKSFIVC